MKTLTDANAAGNRLKISAGPIQTIYLQNQWGVLKIYSFLI